jgi:DNA polymerase-1
VERLNEAGWKPFEKTKGHIQAERDRDPVKLERFRKTGWKVSEDNLATLPATAPEAAQALARRLILSSRKGDFEEWLAAYSSNDGRVHGSFNSIGAWTHRASHHNPNTGNIPAGNNTRPLKNLYAHEMRALWRADKDRLLIGVDADGIQLRIFAHYCKDDRLVEAILKGNKADKTDIHSLNQRGFGDVCKSRDDSKTGIYALLLGSGIPKLANIFDCTVKQAKQAMNNILEFYPGWKILKDEQVKKDYAQGYFEGFDGRLVLVPDMEHKVLAGYLQNGEAVIMKKAKQIWWNKLEKEKIPFWLVNWVHDEWQTETINCMDTALYIAKTQADAIREAGEIYKVYCPLAGSYETDHPTEKGVRIPSIGTNWTHTH